MNSQLVEFVRDIYKTNQFIPLHAPQFNGNEIANVTETIKSTFVSSVGKFVDDFEYKMEAFTGAPKAVAVVNGTAALHASLHLAGVKTNDFVITQALTFVATCNALSHIGAEPIFLDVSTVSLGLSPQAVSDFLEQKAVCQEGDCYHKETGRRIKAMIPMHTFGHPVELDELAILCKKWGIVLIEDAAESLGSFYKGIHTGLIGDYNALSFNGNKIITTGGGGMILCKSVELGVHAQYVTTTAKEPHPYEFYHTEVGFNYRMPNINAALGCAQMDQLEMYLQQKRVLANRYRDFFENSNFQFVVEPEYAKSNYWLNAIICPDVDSRNQLLKESNDQGVMTRPVWQLMHRLPMFKHCMRDDLTNSEWIEAHLINLPSSPVVL